MRCEEWIAKIEEEYPKEAALSWDNVGLLVGRKDKEIKTVFVTLDVTDEVISQAIEAGADMILSHHPMLFTTAKRITDDDITGRRILRLIRHDICCYAAHTNYDTLRMGQLAADRLCLTGCVVLEESGRDGEGIGVVGNLQTEMTLGACCEMVKKAFHLPSVKVFGDLSHSVFRCAVCPGSGKGMSALALEKGADVLITGDIDHHTGIDAVADGLIIIDAGHYGLEHIFVSDMAEFIKSHGLHALQGVIHFPFQNV